MSAENVESDWISQSLGNTGAKGKPSETERETESRGMTSCSGVGLSPGGEGCSQFNLTSADKTVSVSAFISERSLDLRSLPSFSVISAALS